MFGGKATEFPLTTKGLFSDECNNRRQQLTWEFCLHVEEAQPNGLYLLETSRICQAGRARAKAKRVRALCARTRQHSM